MFTGLYRNTIINSNIGLLYSTAASDSVVTPEHSDLLAHSARTVRRIAFIARPTVGLHAKFSCMQRHDISVHYCVGNFATLLKIRILVLIKSYQLSYGAYTLGDRRGDNRPVCMQTIVTISYRPIVMALFIDCRITS